MKSSSAGLEIDITLSEQEVRELGQHELKGLLRFDDTMLYGSTKREFPLTLRYSPEDKDNILAEKEPQGDYFGNADNCTFTIYNYHYNCLLESGCTGDRFFTSGKLIIRSPKHL